MTLAHFNQYSINNVLDVHRLDAYIFGFVSQLELIRFHFGFVDLFNPILKVGQALLFYAC